MDTNFFTNLSRFAQEQYLIQEEILLGKHGAPDEPFMTTRALAELREVSLVTAHNIMTGLREAGYIELRGKKFFLSYSRLAESRPDKSQIIGLIIPVMNNEFYASLAEAVTQLANQKGYRVLTLTTFYSPPEEKKAYDLLIHLAVSGIISCVPASAENMVLYRDCPIPCVLLAHSIDGSHRSSVQVNSFAISQKVAHHLIDQGYQKFLYVGTKNNPIQSDVRYTAFQMELRREGYSLDKEHILSYAQNNKSDAKMLANILSEQTEPVGVFCYHDLIAEQLYRTCHKLGKRIPEDVGIVGFDDLSISTSLQPTLTTVHYRITTMANTALKQLFACIKAPDCPYDNYYIEPTLVIRKSSLLSDNAECIE